MSGTEVAAEWRGEDRVWNTGGDNRYSALEDRTEALSNQRGGKEKCMPNPGHGDNTVKTTLAVGT